MSSNISNSTDLPISPLLLNRVKFGIFLTLQIPSVICSVHLFAQYATRSTLRQSLHNHVVIVLLCSSFLFVTIPISASEAFFFTSSVRPASNFYCAFWTWIHYSTNVGNLILMAFACAELHWLIFRFNPLHRLRIRILRHYLPIAICLIYPWIFYFVFIFLYPCKPLYDFTQLLCIMPCYFLDPVASNIDTFLNNWTPIFAIPILGGSLFVRFLIRKRQTQIQIFRWKRDRKMVMQLITITSLYVLMWAPVQASTVHDYIWNNGVSSQFEIDYLYMLPYFIHLFYPFVILFVTPEFRRQTRNISPQENHQLQQAGPVRIR